jgi:hypothetical protein
VGVRERTEGEGPSEVPWTDADYERLLFFSPPVLEFREPFHEEFEGKSKYSDKIKLNAGQARNISDTVGHVRQVLIADLLGFSLFLAIPTGLFLSVSCRSTCLRFDEPKTRREALFLVK